MENGSMDSPPQLHVPVHGGLARTLTQTDFRVITLNDDRMKYVHRKLSSDRVTKVDELVYSTLLNGCDMTSESGYKSYIYVCTCALFGGTLGASVG